MAGDLDTQRAKLLHQAPHLRPGRPDFLREFGTAYYNGWEAREHTDNPPEPRIGLKAGGRSIGSFGAGLVGRSDARIIV
jgi:hypothetical protein